MNYYTKNKYAWPVVNTTHYSIYKKSEVVKVNKDECSNIQKSSVNVKDIIEDKKDIIEDIKQENSLELENLKKKKKKKKIKILDIINSVKDIDDIDDIDDIFNSSEVDNIQFENKLGKQQKNINKFKNENLSKKKLNDDLDITKVISTIYDWNID